MPDLKSVIQGEIKRLAKKEAKLMLLPMQKTCAQLKQRLAETERKLKAMEKVLPPIPAAPAEPEKKTAGKKAKAKKGLFHGKKIIRLRKRLHLSQNEFAALIGVNMFSVSHWELGKNIPRQAQQEKILELKGLPRKELKARLEEIRKTLAAKQTKTAEKK